MRPERELAGRLALLARGLLLILSIAGILMVLAIPSRLGVPLHGPQYLAFMLGLCSIYIFLKFPATAAGAGETRVPWYDWLCIAGAAATNAYVVVIFPSLTYGLGDILPHRVALGALALLLVFETVRRVSGWPLVVVVGLFVLYARFAEYLPGILYARSPSWSRLASYLYLDPSSLYGVPLSVIAGVVFAFVLFGNFLFTSGGGRFLADGSMWAVGRYIGGPAKMSILSSAAFGTMTGSAAANVALTGMVTIPLMRRVGYPPVFAGAVEAVASSGGLLAPPVMGAAAFLMAEFLSVPYNEIALAALIPAGLYFLAVYVQVDLYARKLGLKGLTRDELPKPEGLLGGAVTFFVPLAALIYALFIVFLPPDSAVMYATGALLVVLVAVDRKRLNLAFFVLVFERTARNLIEPLAISALAGLILGVVTITGLGSTLSQALIFMAGGTLALLLLFTALASIVLGMGLPAVAIYVLLSVLVAPALVEFGVEPLAAHMFIYFFGILSYVTPPMAFACFISGPMAGADPFRTGIEGMRLSFIAYVVPFLFVFQPALLLKGSWQEIAIAGFSAIAGAACLSAAVVGFAFRSLAWPERLAMAASGAALLSAQPMTEIAGAALAFLTVLWLKHGAGRARTAPDG